MELSQGLVGFRMVRMVPVPVAVLVQRPEGPQGVHRGLRCHVPAALDLSPPRRLLRPHLGRLGVLAVLAPVAALPVPLHRLHEQGQQRAECQQ